jgi:hypothetical protein
VPCIAVALLLLLLLLELSGHRHHRQLKLRALPRPLSRLLHTFFCRSSVAACLPSPHACPALSCGCPSAQVDYVRVYQNASAVNLGCSPPDFPTAQYLAW